MCVCVCVRARVGQKGSHFMSVFEEISYNILLFYEQHALSGGSRESQLFFLIFLQNSLFREISVGTVVWFFVGVKFTSRGFFLPLL